MKNSLGFEALTSEDLLGVAAWRDYNESLQVSPKRRRAAALAAMEAACREHGVQLDDPLLWFCKWSREAEDLIGMVQAVADLKQRGFWGTMDDLITDPVVRRAFFGDRADVRREDFEREFARGAAMEEALRGLGFKATRAPWAVLEREARAAKRRCMALSAAEWAPWEDLRGDVLASTRRRRGPGALSREVYSVRDLSPDRCAYNLMKLLMLLTRGHADDSFLRLLWLDGSGRIRISKERAGDVLDVEIGRSVLEKDCRRARDYARVRQESASDPSWLDEMADEDDRAAVRTHVAALLARAKPGSARCVILRHYANLLDGREELSLVDLARASGLTESALSKAKDGVDAVLRRALA